MGRPLNIYVVDDSAVQTDIAKALLEKAGHVVTTNRSSADALREIVHQSPRVFGKPTGLFLPAGTELDIDPDHGDRPGQAAAARRS